MSCRFRTAILLALVVGGVVFVQAAFGQAGNGAPPPFMTDLGSLDIEIVGATFVAKLDGVNARFEESQSDMFRGLVLTLRIKKPAAQELTLVAQDLALHYSYGRGVDVAKCQGLSAFSSQRDVDRPITLYRLGLGRVTTGIATTKSDVVFIDAFFQYMEPGTSDLFLFVAQPVGASFKTNGWK